MDDNKFLDLLVQKKLLEEDKVNRVLQDSHLSGKDVEFLLYEGKMVDDVEVAKAKSEMLNIPFKKVEVEAVSDDVLAMVKAAVVNNYHFVPIDRTDDALVIGMVKPKDIKAQEALRFIGQKNKLNLGIYIISYSDFIALYRRYSPFKGEVEQALQAIREQSTGTKEIGKTLRVINLDEVEGEEDSGPIIHLVASILKNAVQLGSSDIHAEPQKNIFRIRFRIDGELQEALNLPIELHQPITSRIKVLSDLKIDETRKPQDGRFRTSIFNKEIDFRVATFPTTSGEKVVLRVLDPTTGLKSLEELGLMGKNFEILKKELKKPYGMILITGPTGSGKTTSLYSILHVLNQESINLISLEDPVEYTIEGISQSQVMPEIGYSFASGLRQVLRQDPDVIMVGEIRDNETAQLAIHAALTGHLVLSTLHTNNAVGVIPRLTDMSVEAYLLPPAVNVMIGQRLVGRLCSDCKEEYQTKPEQTSIIEKELSLLPSGTENNLPKKGPYKIYKPKGCTECKHKGTKGRIALFEIFIMTPELDEIISTGITEGKIIEEAKRQGMITLRQDGIIKVLQGHTSMEEVLRETDES